VKCAVKEGDVVQVGQLIAVIQSGSASAPEPVVAAATPAVTVSAEPAAVPYTPSSEPVTLVSNSESTRFYSPLVRNIAKNEHISMQELDSIKGNGQGGRVTKEDLMQYLQHRSAAPAPAASPAPATTSAPSQPAMAAAPAPVKAAAPAEPAPKAKSNIVVGPNDEIVEMDRMRKLIADHMVMSKQTSPHVTSYVEADVTNIVLWREKVKKSFEQKEKTKITFTPIFMEAIAKAIKAFIKLCLPGNPKAISLIVSVGVCTSKT
jgi:2-oxoglutarate dehydrogenase E2 component (dihydrolipoamide succinyltransferase)